jgi:SAM-dependent methyltransferase
VTTYVFEHSWQRERDRLAALEDLYDENSIRRLAALGITDGWHCLEVGCGAGGVARWLSDRVGHSGRVVATDLDPRFLRDHRRDNLDVWQHDIVSGPLDEARFDLAHSRAVLEHVPQRRDALARLVSAVRPGGWVVIEDVDFGGAMAPAMARYTLPAGKATLVERILLACGALFAKAGAEASLGPRLPGMLMEAGLVEVGGQVYVPLVAGGTGRDWARLTIEQLGPRFVAAGLLEEREVAEFLAVLSDPQSRYLPPPMVTAWGRRPAD